MKHLSLFPLLLTLALLPACDRSSHSSGDDDADTGADSDTDTDSDSDTDTDADTEADAGPDAGDTDTYEDCNPQYITDENTGLTWWRCHAGGWWEWSGTGCACLYGVTNTMTWDEVQDACDPDWRPATVEELMGVLDACSDWADIEASGSGACNSCENSEPCASLFPSDELQYWSATEAGVDEAYAVWFGTGAVESTSKADEYYVRCVTE